MSLLDQVTPAPVRSGRNWLIADSFQWYIDPHLWSDTLDVGDSTMTIQSSGMGGLKALATTANEEATLTTTNKIFTFGAGTTANPADADSGWFEVKARIDRGSGTSGVFVGLTDDLTDQIADTTGLAQGTFDGFGFVLEPTLAYFKLIYSNSTTQTTITPTATGTAGVSAAAINAALFTDAGSVTLRGEYQVNADRATVDIKWFINGVFIWTANVTITSLGPCYFSAGLKALGSTDEILYIDLVTLGGHRGSGNAGT